MTPLLLAVVVINLVCYAVARSLYNFDRTYARGIEWVAFNDDPGSPDAQKVKSVATMMTVHMLADLFGKKEAEVARAVVECRRRNRI